MPRIMGVDIPDRKILRVALTYLFGVGPTTALKVIAELNLNGAVRANTLTQDELSRIAALLEEKYVVGGQLRRQVSQNIGRLKKIGCYRGIRHGRGLPVRGQNTRNNARTRKGKRRTVAVKQSVKAMR